MARLAIISNPRSQRNRQGALDAVKAVLADHGDVLHEELWDFSELGPLIVRLIRKKVEIIAVNGGDGTVQAVLTELGRRRSMAEATPKLAVLAGGMTNVIAKDVGFDHAPPKAARRLIDALDGADGGVQTVTRPLIGLSLGPDEPPVYGMFFGAVGFYQAVKLANDRVRAKGVAGNLASASTLVLAVTRLLLGRPGKENPLYRGERIGLVVDGAEAQAAESLVLVATTLDRLMLGLMPFWGDGRDAIRFTDVAFPPKHLARALLPALRGRPKPWMRAAGYRSGSARDLSLTIESPVVLDGEIFHPKPGTPIRLTGDRTQTFIQTGGRFA